MDYPGHVRSSSVNVYRAHKHAQNGHSLRTKSLAISPSLSLNMSMARSMGTLNSMHSLHSYHEELPFCGSLQSELSNGSMTSEISALSNGSLFNHSSDGGHSFNVEDAQHDTLPNRKLSHHPLLGMILVTLSAVLYAVLNITVKLLMHSTPWQELMFIRMAITWCSTMAWMLAQYRGRISFFGPSQHRLLLFIRGVFLWGAMFFCWWSFEFLPV